MRQSISVYLAGIIIVLPLFFIAQGCVWKSETSHEKIEGYIQSIDDVELYYRIKGSGEDTLVVVNGGPGLSIYYLEPDLEPLTEKYTVIYYDQRSAGRSTLVIDSVSLHIDKYIADLEAVRRYFGIERLTLFGHSWGAVLGARYMRAYPYNVDRLIMVSPGSVRYDPYEELFTETATAWMDSSTMVEFWKLQAAFENASDNVSVACQEFFDLFNRGGFYDPFNLDAIRRMRGDFCNASESVLNSFFKINQLTFQSLGQYDWRDDFRDIDNPVLIITGIHDIFPENFREWKAAFPIGRLDILDQAGHYPYVERPDEFFQIVGEFLTE